MADPIAPFVRFAKRYERLTQQDEIKLGRAIQEWQCWPGGPEAAPKSIVRAGRKALDRFVLSNQRLAIHVARKYEGAGCDLEDLIQAATEGLIQAYRRFDPSLGYKSASYAIWYAQQGCQKLLQKQSLAIRLPSATYDALRRIMMARDKCYRSGLDPTADNLAAHSDLDVEQVRQVLHAFASVRAIRLDARAPKGAESFGDGAVTEESLGSLDKAQDDLMVHEQLAHAIEFGPDLSYQQSRILRCAFLSSIAMSLPSIAKELNLSRGNARKMMDQALNLLRLRLPGQAADYLASRQSATPPHLTPTQDA